MLLLRSFHKTVFHGNQVFRFFLTHGPAHNIRFAQGEACQDARGIHDLFLIQHHPVGVSQNAVQQRMDALQRVVLLPAFDELVCHARVQRARAVQCHQRHQVPHGPGGQPFYQPCHTRAFQLEHPLGIPGAEHPAHRFIL